MNFTKNIGMLLLAIWLILMGLAAFIPAIGGLGVVLSSWRLRPEFSLFWVDSLLTNLSTPGWEVGLRWVQGENHARANYCRFNSAVAAWRFWFQI